MLSDTSIVEFSNFIKSIKISKYKKLIPKIIWFNNKGCFNW